MAGACPGLERLIAPHGFDNAARHAEDGHLGPVHDGGERGPAKAAQVRDCDTATAHVLEAQLAVPCLFCRLVHLDRDLGDVLLVDVLDDRHQQATLGVGRHTHVNVSLVDDLVSLEIERGVELRILLHGCGQHLDQHRGDGEVAARVGYLLAVLPAQRFHRGDVGLVELRDVRHRTPRVAKVLRRLAPDVGHRLPLDLAPPREVGQRHGGGHAAGRCRAAGRRRGRLAAQQLRRVGLDVVLRDPALRTASLDLGDVYANLARQPTHRRRGRCQPRVAPAARSRGRWEWGRRLCGARHRNHLRGLGDGRVGRPGAFGARLCRTSVLLAGRHARVVHGEHHFPNANLLTSLDSDVLDDAGHRRWYLDGGLVGLELEDRLLERDRVAHLHQHLNHVAGVDVLAQLGDFEFNHARILAGRAAEALAPAATR